MFNSSRGRRGLVAAALLLTIGLPGSAAAQFSENQAATLAALNGGGCAGAANFTTDCTVTVGGGGQADLLQQATSEEIGANTRMSTEASNRQVNAVAGRLTALRGGTTGFIVELPQSQPWDRRGGAAGDDPVVSTTQGRLAGFLNGRYSTGDRDDTALEDGFDFDTQGFTVGLDYRVDENLIIGGAFGYSQLDVDFDTRGTFVSGGDLDTDLYNGSLYGTWFQDNLYVDAILSVGFSDHELDRVVSIGGGTGVSTAKSDTDGRHYGATVGVGMNFAKAATTLTPFLRVNYLDVKVDSFTETGALGFNLRVDDQEYDSLNTELGFQATQAISTGFGVILPRVRAAYVHEFQNDDETTTATFVGQGTPTPFAVRTDEGDDDYFQVGVGVSTVLTGGMQAFVDYQTVVGLSDISNHIISGGLRIEF